MSLRTKVKKEDALRVIRGNYENKGHAFALFASRVQQRTLPH
jgi:hypothetical protein